ncbi:hypothetical protein [Micromonospora carbonacea]|uniref:Uncharacterized protein n=1 Tax=Micromonospora carbonacea TaxID=47853 RepID=A0A1C4V5F6_9ACTN|nr:hypothetical protein [Micromonospora carbonacea]SCE79243.1 hypothetical protein GA0070563_10250 [Micromonospora carbonacea]
MTDTDTTPGRRPPSAVLNQQSPVDAAWTRRVEPRRQQLLDRFDDASRRVIAADEECDDLDAAAGQELAELDAKIPDVGEEPTEVEWLTRRAAQADQQVSYARHDVALREATVRREHSRREAVEVQARIGQIDDLLEGGGYAAGAEAQMAILMLDVQQSGLDLAHEVASLDFARQRLALAEHVQRDVHAALRAAQRSESRAQKPR